jgi:hypothetical protein
MNYDLYIDHCFLDIELNVYYGGSQKDHKSTLWSIYEPNISDAKINYSNLLAL